jgi:hypothetical protein
LLLFPIDSCDFHAVTDEDEVIITAHVACS